MAQRKTKRARGGQPGNQNARKHGFYAVNITLPEIREFCNALYAYGLDPDLIALRIKLKTALRCARGNRRLLGDAARLLAKRYLSKYPLDKKDGAAFKKAVRYIFAEIARNFPERIVAGSDPAKSIITKRIEAKNL